MFVESTSLFQKWFLVFKKEEKIVLFLYAGSNEGVAYFTTRQAGCSYVFFTNSNQTKED